jgi:regulator of RNase E activity RraA
MTAARPQSAELNPGPGFRIRTRYPRDLADLAPEFLRFEVPTISDALNRLYAVDSQIRLLTNPAHRVSGVACTVHVFPGDNLMVHKVLDVARPGDVVVINAHGSVSASPNAALGDLISTKAVHRGIAAFIVDGLIRDLPGIMELDFPVFARGTTAVGPLHRGPGEINYPIACGGTVIEAGDLIVADLSGIVTIPREVARDLLVRLEAGRERSAEYLAAVQRGTFSNAWVDDALASFGCPIDEGVPVLADGA